jgi:hypothetical protein
VRCQHSRLSGAVSIETSMFFPAFFCMVFGTVPFASGYFRWRHPAGQPTGFVYVAEGLLTGRWAWFVKRPLPPWWLSLPMGIIFMATGAFGVVVSFQ